MTIFCIYDCTYCINRVSSNVPRARFSVDEVVRLTIDFYRRNYIEGLFLSSGVIRSPDATMSAMVEIVRKLHEEENFRGYIHLKTIPDAAPELIEEAGRPADRLSINVELPTESGMKSFASEKNPQQIRQAMADFRLRKEVASDVTHTGRKAPRFAPAGQSTQMIVGADRSNDATILSESTRLYSSYKLKRVYYSAFSPIPDSSSKLLLVSPPLVREHRLYQADWLLRFYGFELPEIVGHAKDGNLDLDLDPKLAWALVHREVFPIDIDRADRELLLWVPGFGVKTVNRILGTRRYRSVRYEDVVRMGGLIKKAGPFITAMGWSPGSLIDAVQLRARFLPPPTQLSLL